MQLVTHKTVRVTETPFGTVTEQVPVFINPIEERKPMEMKTKYKFIEFHQSTLITDRVIWDVYNHKYKQLLGFLEYNKKWKEWEFMPSEGTGWTIQCLIDVADFIKQLNKVVE